MNIIESIYNYISEADYLTIIITICITIFTISIIYSKIAEYLDSPKSQINKFHELGGKCKVQISSPGGYSKLKLEAFDKDLPATIGANITKAEAWDSETKTPKEGFCIVNIHYFGVNFADIFIRWGLYESANKYVGYPISPGFEFSGVISNICVKSKYKIGEKVIGLSLFGGYSTDILIPTSQIFKLPTNTSMSSGAGILCTAFTAYYALFKICPLREKSKVLVHSAAGGVGSMLCQMLKISECSVCGVVGSTHKVNICRQLGCDYVVDKSKFPLWNSVREFSNYFDIIFDANGVDTLRDSYRHLGACGKLVIYGFHTMAPKSGLLSLFGWLLMIYKYLRSPKFTPLDMVANNRSLLAFNLSFLFTREDLIPQIMEYLIKWIEDGRLKVAKVTTFDIWEIGKAHQLLQTGKTIGKVVIRTAHND